MKKVFITILIAHLCVPVLVAQDRLKYIRDIIEYEQELKTLVSTVIDSLGGKQPNIKSTYFLATGVMLQEGSTQQPFEMYTLKRRWARIDVKGDSLNYSISRYGRRGWIHDNDSHTSLRRRTLDEHHYSHFYTNNLFTFEDQGLEVYYEGEVKTDFVEAYIIRLTGLSYGEEMYFISKESYLPIMKQVYLLNGEQEVIHYELSDYRRVNEVLMPFSISIKHGDDMRLFLINEVNTEFQPTESLFKEY